MRCSRVVPSLCAKKLSTERQYGRLHSRGGYCLDLDLWSLNSNNVIVFDWFSYSCPSPHPLPTAPPRSANQEFPLRYASTLDAAGYTEEAHAVFGQVIRRLNHVWFHMEGGSDVTRMLRPGGIDGG